jgi:hypothetical protein
MGRVIEFLGDEVGDEAGDELSDGQRWACDGTDDLSDKVGRWVGVEYCFFFFGKIDQKNNCRFGEIIWYQQIC